MCLQTATTRPCLYLSTKRSIYHGSFTTAMTSPTSPILSGVNRTTPNPKWHVMSSRLVTQTRYSNATRLWDDLHHCLNLNVSPPTVSPEPHRLTFMNRPVTRFMSVKSSLRDYMWESVIVSFTKVLWLDTSSCICKYEI